MEKDEKKCPLCNHKLQKKNEGLACVNWNCKLYFKCAKGWIYLDGSIKNNLKYFQDKYDFNIQRFENQKEWLKLKSKIFSEREKVCEICREEIPPFNLHHILSRADYPNLTFDEENLMVLCDKCHKKIHEEDKHAYR